MSCLSCPETVTAVWPVCVAGCKILILDSAGARRVTKTSSRGQGTGQRGAGGEAQQCKADAGARPSRRRPKGAVLVSGGLVGIIEVGLE